MEPKRRNDTGLGGRESFVDRDFVLMFIANLFCGFAFYLLLTCMVEYAIVTYDVSAPLAGLTASIFVLGEMGGRVLVGAFGKMVPEYRSSLLALALFAAMSTLYLLDMSIYGLMLIRVFQGVGFGIGTTTIQGIAYANLPKSRYAEGTNVFSLSVTTGTALGPLAGLLLVRHIPYGVVFSISMVLSFLSLLSFVAVKKGRKLYVGTSPVVMQKVTDGLPDGWLRLARTSHLTKTFLFVPIVLVMGLSFYSITTFINGFGLSEGYGNFPAYLFGFYFIGLVIFRPLAGKLIDRGKQALVMIIALCVFSLMYTFLGITPCAPFLLIIGVMLAFGFGVLLSSGLALCSQGVRPDQKTGIVALYFIAFNAGCVLGAYLAGNMVLAIGYRGMYLFWGAAIVPLVIYYFIVRKRFDVDL